MAKKVNYACGECRRIIEIPQGNLGWWLKSDKQSEWTWSASGALSLVGEVIAKTKKELVKMAFINENGREPTSAEHTEWAKEHKDDIEKIIPPNPECNAHPDAHCTGDWLGYVVILNPSRSEIAKKLNVETPGNYALKVNIR